MTAALFVFAFVCLAALRSLRVGGPRLDRQPRAGDFSGGFTWE